MTGRVVCNALVKAGTGNWLCRSSCGELPEAGAILGLGHPPSKNV